MLFLNPPQDFKSAFEAVGCYLEYDGAILLLHYVEAHKPMGALWGPPAGKMEVGEAPVQAVVREVQEEAGIVLDIDRIKFLKKMYVRYPQFDFVYYVFSVQLLGKPTVILDSNEHQEYKWVRPRDAHSMPLVWDEDECIKMFFNF